MVKRKFYASLIMLIVASMTLVSGTYAWFLVGGFGSLFDLGFDVIDAGAGLEIKGSASGATWKNELVRADFAEGSFLAESSGRYAPISSTNGSSFIKVNLEGNNYLSNSTVTPGGDYNDFKVYVRSSTEAPVNVGMKVALSSDDGETASKAARVAVTYGGTTTVYALEGQAATSAVTSTFADGAIVDADSDRIITSADSGYSAAGLTAQTITELKADGNIATSNSPILLENVVANSDNAGSEIHVKVWIEGNDADCIDFGENSIAGDTLTVKISFTTAV